MFNLNIFSAVNLIMASVSVAAGYYVLRLYPKGTLNRLFFAISLCVAFWSMSFAVIVIAPNAETAKVWTRVAAIGYSIVFSLIFHFLLVLTGLVNKIKSKAFYVLLYLPSALLLYFLTISPHFTNLHYNFEQKPNGWISTTGVKAFDVFFQSYYIIYCAFSMALLVLWKVKNKEKKVKIQSNVILLSLIVSFLIGSFTDIFSSRLFGISIPKLAPVLFIVPLVAISYCISKFQIFKPPNVHATEMIISYKNRINVFSWTVVGLFSGGIVTYFVVYVIWEVKMTHLFTVSIALLSSLAILLAYVVKKNKGFIVLEIMLILVSVTITPIISSSMKDYPSSANWSFMLMFVICSLVFNRDAMLVSSTVSLILSQVYLMGIDNNYENNKVYITRIISIVFIVISAYYVHTIYLSRLRDNAMQARLESLFNEIDNSFKEAARDVKLSRNNVILVKLSEFFEPLYTLAYTSVSILSYEQGTLYYSPRNYQITDDEAEEVISTWESFTEKNIGKINLQTDSGGVYIPLFINGEPLSFIFMKSPNKQKKWSQRHLVAVPMLSRIISDAIAKIISETKIRHMAYFDHITHLPNRQSFHEKSEFIIAQAYEREISLAIMFLDLDNFKSVNDVLGHEGGDRLIARIASHLVEILDEKNIISRFGGDEFIILLDDIKNADEIVENADKIINLFKEPFRLNDQEVFVTASMGVAVYPKDGEDISTLIKHADIAMHKAKDNGKNQYMFCSEHMKEHLNYRINLTNDMYRALERGEFQVYYQPQISMNSERISGMEALLRWFHPKYGAIPPSLFIPLAEQTGLINAIGEWVLETACNQLVAWENQGHKELIVAVNLSIVQLRNPGVVKVIKNIINKTGVDANRLELEITETATTKEPEYIISVLNELKSLGVKMSIDDFGTEYSSLSRLKAMPIDKLKMDIQFVRGIEKTKKDQDIADVIINLAKTLDLSLIAEGVETEAQLSFLRKRNCDEIQGYYFYKPMPAEDLNHILSAEALKT